MKKQLTIGQFGFGVVGEGIYRILEERKEVGRIKKIAIRHQEKERQAPATLFTTDAEEILNDPEIDTIVELIDDSAEAYRIVKRALISGRHVVSANKKMIAAHLPELVYLQQQHQSVFLYEAAVCGSIPVLRTLDSYFSSEEIRSFRGIVNGSTNYILTRQSKEGLSYNEALKQAQQLGFAEADPSLDVEGYDAANKLSIVLAHAFGAFVHPDEILRVGIHRIHPADQAFAAQQGCEIKLVAQVQPLAGNRLAAWVAPQLVKAGDPLSPIQYEYNGVVLDNQWSGTQLLTGKGAGRFPTASAVLSDLAALQHGQAYRYAKRGTEKTTNLSDQYYLKVLVSFEADTEVSKWEFEEVLEYHSTPGRKYLTGVIRASHLERATWFRDPAVSIVLLPEPLIQRDAIIEQSVKRLSLQLAGVN